MHLQEQRDLNQTKHDQQVQAEPGLQVPQSCAGEAFLDLALQTQASSAILMHLKKKEIELLDPRVDINCILGTRCFRFGLNGIVAGKEL